MLTRTKNQFRPTLDVLEARECLSATAFLDGHTLHVIGTDAAETVDVYQTESQDKLSVFVDHVQLFFNPGHLNRVHIDLKGGDDVLTYRFNDGPVSHDRTINIDLGGGRDRALLYFDRSIYDPKAPGGAYGNIPGGMAIHAALNVRVDAGSGNDDVSAWFGPVENGQVNCRLFLGDGNDVGRVYLNGGVSADSAVDFIVRGQEGDDQVGAKVDLGGVIAGELRIQARGGAGHDIGATL